MVASNKTTLGILIQRKGYWVWIGIGNY